MLHSTVLLLKMSADAAWLVISIPKNAPFNENQETVKIRNDIGVEHGKSKTWKQVLEECIDHLKISDSVWTTTADSNRTQVYFSVDIEESEATLNYLNSMGFEIEPNSVSHILV